MAVGEARQQAKSGNIISQVSWTDWTALDVYYWLDHSFQYSRNINCDDELHGIKLATQAIFTTSYAKCQLTSLGDNWVMALPVDVKDSGDEKRLKRFQYNWANATSPHTASTWEEFDSQAWTTYSYNYRTIAWVVFQDRFWFGSNREAPAQPTDTPLGYLTSVPITWTNTEHGSVHQDIYLPYDHPESTDESIEDSSNVLLPMSWQITAILNYNNTRLVVAAWQEIWVYYPELDHWFMENGKYWKQWWKKVLTYEAWVTVVWLTCSFEYLKTWCVDEWWNSKVYYYQGNNNLRNTFVYNLVDLTWVRVVKVYNINWIDYYVSSLDGSDWFVNLYKLVGDTPVQLFKQRAWLDPLDVNYKAPYFVWPVGMNAAYAMWKFYIADSYGLFQFTYNPQSYDTGYMKWELPNMDWWTPTRTTKQVYGVCENQWWLYVSTYDWCFAMRVWDTWVDGYQEDWILISREFEGKEWGTVTKMLDEVRLNFELNPNIVESSYASNSQPYGTIEIYVSPNNLWKDTIPNSPSTDNWYKVMKITKDSKWTRTEKSNLFNDLNSWQSAFKFDWQTITYAIVIKRGSEPKATPIVRQIDLKYHCKDKVNKVYDIN